MTGQSCGRYVVIRRAALPHFLGSAVKPRESVD
jgi:hypothetical protein